MQNGDILLLEKRIDEVAKRLSNPFRSRNFSKETFVWESTEVSSDEVAIVTYLKNSGLRCVVVFLSIRSGDTIRWLDFIPTDKHILGLQFVSQYKQKIEALNYLKKSEMQKCIPNGPVDVAIKPKV